MSKSEKDSVRFLRELLFQLWRTTVSKVSLKALVLKGLLLKVLDLEGLS